MPRVKCRGGCGRWLTAPEAVAVGYGRVCAERHGIRATRPARTRRPPKVTVRGSDPPEPMPGQTVLDLAAVGTG